MLWFGFGQNVINVSFIRNNAQNFISIVLKFLGSFPLSGIYVQKYTGVCYPDFE